jgi:4-amino-4-deoxy-L-arabinose transferase-like glycosyltransferase
MNMETRRGATQFNITSDAIVLSLSGAAFLLHLYAAGRYGYFTDELYYLACSHHLAWGYVDQPPLIALVTWITRQLLGESLIALRLVPAMASAAEIALTGLIARELGGGRFAQMLACVAALVAPGILISDSLLTMNAFEPLFWLACAYLFIRIVRSGDQRLWLWIGGLAGIGLENKYSMLIFGAGLVLGTVLTPQRRFFLSPWPWIGGAIAFLIFLPNLLWNFEHHFPFLELHANIQRSGRDVPLSPLAFFAEEALTLLPLTLPIWLAGLWFFIFTEAGKPFRALGWAWLFTAAVIAALSPRIYYLYPAMPILLAAGSVAWESWLAQPRYAVPKFAYVALMIVGGAIVAPLAVPILPVETYIRYTNAMHLRPPRIETHALGPLPQIYADQFGWPEMAAAVARVYNALPKDVRAHTAIFGQNYGQAGAIDLFGPRYGLPPAISGHQNYFLWGPRGYTGESMIVLDDTQETLEKICTHVKKVAHFEHPYSMPYQHFDIFYCQGLRPPLKVLWPKIKSWN